MKQLRLVKTYQQLGNVWFSHVLCITFKHAP